MATHDQPTAREEAAEVVNRLVPWTISILAHAGLLLLAVFIAWSARLPTEEPEAYSVTMSRSADLPALEHSSVADPNPNPAPSSASPRITRGPDVGEPTIQPTRQLHPSPFSGPANRRSVNPFERGLATSRSPYDTGIFGPTANARRVVYIIDASGSLIDTLPHVITELKRMIHSLEAEHEFAIVFYNGDGVHEAGPAGHEEG